VARSCVYQFIMLSAIALAWSPADDTDVPGRPYADNRPYADTDDHHEQRHSVDRRPVALTDCFVTGFPSPSSSSSPPSAAAAAAARSHQSHTTVNMLPAGCQVMNRAVLTMFISLISFATTGMLATVPTWYLSVTLSLLLSSSFCLTDNVY